MSGRFIQVIPLFLGSHSAILQYFKEHKREINAVTGAVLGVVVPETVMKGEAEDVVRAAYSQRYPDLVLDQLPCLWVEASDGQHFTIALQDSIDSIRVALLRLTDSVKRNAGDFKKIREAYMSKEPVEGVRDNRVPPWFPKAGFAALACTLLFLMGIVLLSMMDRRADPMLVVFVVSIGLAMATSFLGGNAAAEGRLPIPFLKDHPVAFSASGGIAVFVIAALIGYWTYAHPISSTAAAAQLEITEVSADGLYVDRSTTLTALVKNKSNGRFLNEVRTIWSVDKKPVQDVRESLDVPAEQGTAELHANHRFETPGKKVVRVEIQQVTGMTSSILAAKDVVVTVASTMAGSIGPVSAEDRFEGTWYISFHFLGTPSDPPKPWFSWTGHLAQNGNQVSGQVSSGDYVGEVRGSVSDNTLSGSVRFPWDNGDWWPEFRLTLSEDSQSATGSARYEFTDARGTHAYRLEAHRLPG